jgi:ppGpp synthetase/RelA/SpoT-type nucleotidyltranferase
MEALVEAHFPYWKGGRPPDSPGERVRQVHDWLSAQVRPYKAVATALIARVEPLVRALKLELPTGEKERFFYRLDSEHIVKSPVSILEKMARAWGKNKCRGLPPIGFDDLRGVKDLGRFRIVASFLSDAEAIRRKLESPYDTSRLPRLSEDEQRLRQEFMLTNNTFEDLIAVSPALRQSGERCFKALFAPRRGEYSVCSVEVQIVTAFQEAWDKKDHFLIYERRRMGHSVPELDLRVSFALSEQLYLTDLFFDQLKRGAAPPSSSNE